MKGLQIGILALLFVIAALLGALVFQQASKGTEETVAVEPIPAAAPAAELSPAAPAPQRAKPRPAPAPRKPAPAAPPAAKPAAMPMSAAAPQPAETASEPAAAPARAPSRILQPETPAAPPPAPRKVSLPSGYPLKVWLIDTVSSAGHQVGDTFVAGLDEALVVNGVTIAEKYARVDGRVVESHKGGRIKGRAGISLALVRLHAADGQKLEIATAPHEHTAKSTVKKDAAKVGILTGIGAAAGAIIGGGKGTAIGAASGAGAGGGTVAATRGADAVIPSETRVVFYLAHPIEFVEKQ